MFAYGYGLKPIDFSFILKNWWTKDGLFEPDLIIIIINEIGAMKAILNSTDNL